MWIDFLISFLENLNENVSKRTFMVNWKGGGGGPNKTEIAMSLNLYSSLILLHEGINRHFFLKNLEILHKVNEELLNTSSGKINGSPSKKV